MSANSNTASRTRIREKLETVGLKVTPQRLTVLEAMLSHVRRHLTAEDIYKKISEGPRRVGMATIYRVLGQLTDVGIVARHLFDAEFGRAVYEVQHDRHHDHLICLQCGLVDEFVDEAITELSHARAASRGFTLSQHQLALYGYCAECRAAPRTSLSA